MVAAKKAVSRPTTATTVMETGASTYRALQRANI